MLSGQAFAVIGGPEHNAFAKAKGAELRSIVGCVDRGNNYFCACPGFEPKNTDWPSYFRGKSIAVGPFSGTPTRSCAALGKWKLDAKRDVTLIETGNSATIAVVRAKQAQIGEATEPFVTQGVRTNVWGEPFFNVPKEMGPRRIPPSTCASKPSRRSPSWCAPSCAAWQRASSLYGNPAEAAEIAKAQFPTMPIEDLRATLDRSFKDEMWSRDGTISRCRPGPPRAPWCARPASSRATSSTKRSST